MKHLGVTATRKGLTEVQRKVAHELMRDYDEFHFGDCVGGDVELFNIAKRLGIKTIAHPPLNPKYRAWCKADVILAPCSYMTRNLHVVSSSNRMLGFPFQQAEQSYGGTWGTIRIARREMRIGRAMELIVVYPDGGIDNS